MDVNHPVTRILPSIQPSQVNVNAPSGFGILQLYAYGLYEMNNKGFDFVWFRPYSSCSSNESTTHSLSFPQFDK